MKENLTFHELIYLTELSVESGKIDKEYNDLLRACRQLNISSYILNLIILEKKKSAKIIEKDIPFDDFFIVAKSKAISHKIEPKERVIIQKETSHRWGIFTYILFSVFLLFVIYVIFMANEHPIIGYWLFNI
ncbi:MAG: hypothetical protein IJE12_05775 [Prevotella sp.]|nr:hypothetical protein [Prevotella sp.]